ncbi:MAG: hypothetical protein JWN08_3572 [Frankiales bacterium]|nr:hypothetical protein [Frankiales bacterium]
MPGPELIDVAGLLAGDGPRVRWSADNQLQTNLVVLAPGARVDRHVEHDLDVTLVVVAGDAVLAHGPSDDVTSEQVRSPAVVVLPAGTSRSVVAGPDGVAYVTAHRARPSLLPRLR